MNSIIIRLILRGSTLNYDEIALALIYGRGKGNHDLSEYDEVRGHDIAYDRIRELVEDGRPLTEMFIRDLNALILVRPFGKKAKTLDGKDSVKEIRGGVYKDKPNSVELPNGELHWYASPEETPILMGELMEWYRAVDEAGRVHPVEVAARWHFEFVKIHPFDDGNGRIARLIMNYILMKNGLPPVIIKSADKSNYLAALQDADMGNVQSFVDYIATQLVWSLELSIRAAKKESVDEAGDLKKKVASLRKQIGEVPTDEILKRSPEAIRRIVDEVVIPFAQAWEKTIRGFDAFFFSRQVFVVIDGRRIMGTDMCLTLERACADSLYPVLAQGRMTNQIELYCDPKGLRKGNRDTGLNGGRVTFFFMDHTYEVGSAVAGLSGNKLYDQPHTAEELEAMAEKVGTFLYNVIVQTLNLKPDGPDGDDTYMMFTKRS